jgi:hypothetical protein
VALLDAHYLVADATGIEHFAAADLSASVDRGGLTDRGLITGLLE